MDNYDRLREILDTTVSGAPKSKYFDEILRILFTPGEAAIAANMKFKGELPWEIARRAGTGEAETGEVLAAMTRKGLVNYRKKDGMVLYNLLPTVPGIFETSMMNEGDREKHARLAALWDEYNREAMIKSLGGSPTPQMRVVAVKESITAESAVYSYEEVAGLIAGSGYIAVAMCACRTSAGKCDRPLEACLVFGQLGENLTEQGLARTVTKEEALNILRECEEAGLVHCSNNSADRATIVCNCCSCCCHFFRGITEHGFPHMVAPSMFIAAIDPAQCTGCGACADSRCPVGAITVSGEAAVADRKRCIGCGLCAGVCPAGALSLIRREAAPATPKTLLEMGMNILREKGRLEDFMKYI